MNRNWYVMSFAVLLAIASGGRALLSSVETTRRSQPADPELAPNLPPPLTGWVFGRLIGVPGAEKPLTSQSGIRFYPPPQR